MTYSTDYHDSASKKRNIFYFIKTEENDKWKCYMYSYYKPTLFYIHYLQLQLEITKDSIGLISIYVFPWIFKTTHVNDFSGTLILRVHVNMQKTNTRVQNVKNSHTRCSHMECCEGEYIFWMLVLKHKEIHLTNWPNITCIHSNSTQPKNLIYMNLTCLRRHKYRWFITHVGFSHTSKN